MKITLVKVYDSRKEHILGEPAKGFYGMMSIDASIEGIRTRKILTRSSST